MAKPAKTPVKGDGRPNGNGAADDAAPAEGPMPAQPTAAPEPPQATKQPEARAQPSMKILGQYLKDLSFENPNSPQSLSVQQGQPEINIQVNVNAKPLATNDYEVELHLEAKATHQSKVVFAADLLYAGVFRLENIPQEALHPIVLVECPRMLFPFARQILADATRNGGFPPLMLDPIDFAGMYQRRLSESRASA